ncbi:hypothetical protein OJF2_61890 [Aquisphaera giovannonii]|uniref:Uncharacterized protein n=1 Tax=Aquisphaera giovannonii TaxID=406548 RepID=A0A5B9WAD7_9BACT|nr:hypothetical protein [Aquisphaera giovannonii]QEH37598.1 hypothetical protein OJF2_61890 [Aquisphaera giovannonii]
MSYRIPLTLALLAIQASVYGQPYVFIGPGSTAQGDYLRGLGVAAYGVGQGDVFEAQAEGIRLDNAIRFNEYVASVLKNENSENARHRAEMLRKAKENYDTRLKQLLESPDARDVARGNALNVLLEELNSPAIHPSTHRYVEVPLSIDEVRRIPFSLPRKGVKGFSMQRLTVKKRINWPLAFQDNQFERDRKRYHDALDHLLELHVQGAAQMEALDRLKSAVAALSDHLDAAFAGRETDRQFIEGRAKIRDLNDIIEMMKAHKIQLALVDLDHYDGRTVNDLREFMRRHNLQFAVPETPEEKQLFPDLYARLKIHLEKAKGGADGPIRD